MVQLARGANVPITASSVALSVSGTSPGTVDLLVFSLAADRKVRTDDDFVFFNHPTSPDGSIQLTGGDRVSVDLSRVPADIETLAIAVALDDGVAGSLATIPTLGVVADQPGAERVEAPASGLTSERAAVLLEIYRRSGMWKMRNVSAGWDGGLPALATEHGVSVDQPGGGVPDAPAPAATAPTPPTDGGVRVAPGEEKLSLVKREKLDLRKREVQKVLLTKGASGVRARIVLVIDKTGSMHAQYQRQVVHRVVERMVPVAIQLDDDGTLEAYLYGKSFARLPDLRVADLEVWQDTFLHLSGRHGGIDYGRIGGFNDEVPIIGEILRTLVPGASMPTLVLFFTDGGFSKRKEITDLIRQASTLPAFWQFVGIGRANYGLLEDLDELSGRAVDNVGFFALDDIDQVDDGELYRRLLSEFPDWLAAARKAGILGWAPAAKR